MLVLKRTSDTTGRATAQLNINQFLADASVLDAQAALRESDTTREAIVLEKCGEGQDWFALSTSGVVRLSLSSPDQNGLVEVVAVTEGLGEDSHITRSGLNQWKQIASSVMYAPRDDSARIESPSVHLEQVQPGSILQIPLPSAADLMRYFSFRR